MLVDFQHFILFIITLVFTEKVKTKKSMKQFIQMQKKKMLTTKSALKILSDVHQPMNLLVPCRVVMETGTISSLKYPAFCAASHFC